MHDNKGLKAIDLMELGTEGGAAWGCTVHLK
jgi:hypothetical protein